MKRYNPSDIEQKWQQTWETNGTYEVDLDDTSRPKYLGFSMLPGITGAGIHIGHGRTFQFSDIKVRAKRQQGFNAYHPIGWDSFGLPVENYAIKIGKKPRVAHDEAKANFIKQLKRLGYSYDWSKEISTADPEYYKWTQWIFTQLYKHDLAYQKESPQWWCEHDQTVLANEQVEGGKCWRCGNPVVKKNLNQWFFKITEYADEMLEATDALDWTDMVKTMQKNWIGKSQGAEVEFKIAASPSESTETASLRGSTWEPSPFESRAADSSEDSTASSSPMIITVFTTRPDTLFGATFLVLAPEHELAKALATDEQRDAVEGYIADAARKSEIERMSESREKTGVFTGSYVINPATGEQIPVWIADYVLAGYGTGAVMAVPAHDERDFAFAKAFDLPIKQVVLPIEDDKDNPPRPEFEEVERETVIVHLRDKSTGKFALLKLHGDMEGITSAIMGGIEEGQTPDEAALAEIREEAALENVTIVKHARWITGSRYCAAHKQQSRKAICHGLLAEVDSLDQQGVIDESEQRLHTLEWIDEKDVEASLTPDHQKEVWRTLWTDEAISGNGELMNSGVFDGMPTDQAREEIVDWLEQQGTGRSKVTYKMRDWLISRQRYWGAPIPIVHVKDYGPTAVPDSQLPVELPDVDDYKPKGGATSVLATIEDWVHIWYNMDTGESIPFSQDKPEHGDWREAHRETDTLDGYACSSWYFLRYIDPFNTDAAWSVERADHWQPVDFYNGGDHAVAHLLYSRFWMRFFYKLGLVPTPEPFKRMMYNAYIMATDGSKMSKSKGNTIDPLEIMDSGYGADSLRVYEMFIAPYDLDAPWDTRGVPGTYRFLNRVWTLAQEYIEASSTDAHESVDKEILKIAHSTVKKVTADIEDDKFNTAVSSMMEAVNGLYKVKEAHGIAQSDAWKFAIESLLQVLAPFAPHITEELWADLGHDDTIHRDHWPQWDEAYLTSDVMTVIVQVNGKLRAKLELSKELSEDDVKDAALAHEHVAKFVTGEPKKVIYIPGKLVNIVA